MTAGSVRGSAARRGEEEVRSGKIVTFRSLEADDIPAALEYAAAAVQERELPVTRPA
jgi:hypothetical protein